MVFLSLHDVFHQQPVDDLAADDVLAKDLFRILGGWHVVPDVLGIDDDRWTVFAVLHAACAGDAHVLIGQARLLYAFLQDLEHFLGAAVLAAAARMIGCALIEADEDVKLETGFFHVATIYGGGVARCQVVDTASRPCGCGTAASSGSSGRTPDRAASDR